MCKALMDNNMALGINEKHFGWKRKAVLKYYHADETFFSCA